MIQFTVGIFNFSNYKRLLTAVREAETKLLAFLLVLLFWRLIISPLPSSFWIDETGTYWVSTGSFAEVLEKLGETQFPQMPLFALLTWTWTRLAGTSEAAFRLPSVFAFGLAGYLLFRLSNKMFPAPPKAGLYTLICYMAMSSVTFAATDARAYSLALLCLIWTYTERWNTLQSPAWPAIIRHGAAAGLTLHFCYFFGPLSSPIS